jgi:hypothetical protein
MGASGDGPSRGGYIVVQPTECAVNESVAVSGRWLERERPEGSPILPMAAARVELAHGRRQPDRPIGSTSPELDLEAIPAP